MMTDKMEEAMKAIHRVRLDPTEDRLRRLENRVERLTDILEGIVWFLWEGRAEK